jgi:hypothetical protein
VSKGRVNVWWRCGHGDRSSKKQGTGPLVKGHGMLYAVEAAMFTGVGDVRETLQRGQRRCYRLQASGPVATLVVLERCNRWAGTTNDVTTSKDALKRIQLPVSSWRMIRRKSRENKGGVIY